MDMKCDACVSAVKNNLLKLDGTTHDPCLNNYVEKISSYLLSGFCQYTAGMFQLITHFLFFFVKQGIKNVDVDLSNQVVRILGSVPVKSMEEALAQTGRSARLIGQGNPNGWLLFFPCCIHAKT